LGSDGAFISGFYSPVVKRAEKSINATGQTTDFAIHPWACWLSLDGVDRCEDSKSVAVDYGSSIVIVRLVSSFAVTLPKSTAAIACEKSPANPSVIVAEFPDVDIWKFPEFNFSFSF
jgi:hypothetical protein